MENLNKYISEKMFLLKNSEKTFKDIFEITHDQEDRIFSEITDGYKVLTTKYKDVKRYSLSMGAYLKEKLSNLEKGAYVGLLMENSLLWVASFWGILMAGYKPVLLNARLSKKLNEEVMSMTNITHIVSNTKTIFDVNDVIVSLDNLPECKGNEEFEWANEIALSTSATTLNIKVCVYDGKSICSQIMNTKRIVKENSMVKGRYKGNLKILAFLPFYHIFGLVATYFWFAFFGRTFVFLKDYSTDTILKTIRKHKVTHVFAVPMLWHGIYREVTVQLNSRDEKTKKKFEKGVKLSLFIQNIFPKLGKRLASKMFEEIQTKVFGDSIQFMITGGGYISNDANELINAIGYPLYNGYGMSEIGITSVELRKRVKHRLKGTIGRPFDSIEYHIQDDVLMVRGESMCKTIITKDSTTNIDNTKWFSTTDLCGLHEDGTYLINGRVDDVVISSSGEKINPDIIEKTIFIPSAIRHCVLGLNENNSSLSLVVEISEGLNSLSAKELLSEIESNLNSLNQNCAIEKIYYTYDPIAAKTAVKVSRSILKKWIASGDVKLFDYNELKTKANANDEEIVNEIALKVKEIMAEVLSIDLSKINVKSHYIFDLGGSSLGYISLLMKLKENFGVDFNTANEKGLYNAEQFANYIMEKKGVKTDE